MWWVEECVMLKELLVIGVMTGNSMDAVDVVLTTFDKDGKMKDLATHTQPYSRDLYTVLADLRKAVNTHKGNMPLVRASYRYTHKGTTHNLTQVDRMYMDAVAKTVKSLIAKAHKDPALVKTYGTNFRINLVGSHGQNLAHYPPSIAAKSGRTPYTIQLGDGQYLANQLNIPVVYDFRTADMKNGGEGAPVGPFHQKVLATQISGGVKPRIAFCNAGNTGNIGVVSTRGKAQKVMTLGWDIGPFNYFSDQLMRQEKNKNWDMDGAHAAKGRVNANLLRLIVNRAIVDSRGGNFLWKKPPKSSDGQWYKLLPELRGGVALKGDKKPLKFSDRIRTGGYAAAYTYVLALDQVPKDVMLPTTFALCGGGWKNTIIRSHFEDLIHGRNEARSPILPEHREIFTRVYKRLQKAAKTTGSPVRIAMSDAFGFGSDAMEARIFAHMAVAFTRNQPFTFPEITGCKSPTVCGKIAYPQKSL